ncbi:peptidoglycan D,D-transpeptidase FtsI family protein [Humibacter ginsenosidimutans]|uniref:Penicillin-binding protein 2 n=1 Tax=Humibacter ginsenosidimutans TaxID=2599293 RepID=A0A5B8LZX1_9MICO|nr:penicillin-binding protein 2 [Humibacter ginsenosidimutans]QDZ13673.1 penicillin-binding protein 2 [Humibacter ginsenosidimutans]
MTSVASRRRRATVAIATVIVIVIVFVVRLVDVQVVQADSLNRKAAEQRGDVSVINGTRGSIVSEDGTVLARSVLRYDFIATPKYTKKPFDVTIDGATKKMTLAQAAPVIAAITGQKATDITEPIQSALATNKNSMYAPIVQNVDVSTYQKLTALHISWLNSTSHETRVYPNGAVAGNILGFLNGDGVAQAGLEESGNACLAGKNGEETYQVGEDGVTIPGSTKVQKAAKQGGQLVTTLNSDLQWFAQDELAKTVKQLGAQFGMISVVSIKDAKIRVAAQYPSADPNDLDATPTEYWPAMMFQSIYEPGSIFKPLTAAALLDTGKATPTTHAVVPDTFAPQQGVFVSDNESHPVQNLTLTGILTESSNVGMSEIGTTMTDQARYEFLKKFGIGKATAVDFPGEQSGILTKPSTWDEQTKYATTFGQGLSTTQAQMLSAYQAIANGGVQVPLSLVEGCKQADGTMTQVPSKKGTRVVTAKTSQEILGMLENVLKGGPLSTLPDTEIPGYLVAAKTGTAQEPDGHGGYQQNYYVSVMGVAPVDDPQYLVSVNIGFPTTIRTSMAAGPLFKLMMSQVLKDYRVQPSTGSPANYPDTY